MSEIKSGIPEALERLVDASSLWCVVEALAVIAMEKAEHIQSNWQDEHLAQDWALASCVLDRATARLQKIGV